MPCMCENDHSHCSSRIDGFNLLNCSFCTLRRVISMRRKTNKKVSKKTEAANWQGDLGASVKIEAAFNSV